MNRCTHCHEKLGTKIKRINGEEFCSNTCYLTHRKKKNFEIGLCFCGKEREGESKNCRSCLDKNRDINRAKRGYRGTLRPCSECYQTGHVPRTCPMRKAA